VIMGLSLALHGTNVVGVAFMSTSAGQAGPPSDFPQRTWQAIGKNMREQAAHFAPACRAAGRAYWVHARIGALTESG